MILIPRVRNQQRILPRALDERSTLHLSKPPALHLARIVRRLNGQARQLFRANQPGGPQAHSSVAPSS